MHTRIFMTRWFFAGVLGAASLLAGCGGGGDGGGAAPTPSPPPPAPPPAAATVTRVAPGGVHSLALKSDGTVWSWGGNVNGMLGTGASATYSITPSAVVLGNGSRVNDVVSLSAGSSHTLAVRSGGTVLAWGGNALLSLGDGTATNRAYAVPVIEASGAAFSGVSQVAAGNDFSVAAKTDGTVWVWGGYATGQFGPVRYPVQVLGPAGGALTGITRVAAGNGFFLALRSDRTVWAWGLNTSGTLGNGSASTVAFSSTAVQVETAPGVPLTGIVEVAGGYTHALAVASDGRVYSWGNDYLGRAATGVARQRAALVTDAAGTPITDVANAVAGYHFSMLRKTDGTLLTFGLNDGKLSANSGNIEEIWPVSVRDSSGAVFGNVAQISAPIRHVLVLRQDGTTWGWGYNESGQLAVMPVTPNLVVLNPIRLPSF